MALNVGDVFATLGLKKDGFDRGLSEAEGQAKGFGSKVGAAMQAARAGSMALGAGLAAVGVAGLIASVDINKGMANVASLMPGNSARVKELKGEIQSLAIETGKGTGDMADGLYMVISAFGDTADTVKILETNAKAATAGLATTTDSINLTSAVTKAYGDTSAAAVSKAADLALMTVRLGQTTFPELAASIGAVTPLTKGLGVSQEELFATMATLTGVTGGAAEVSTQLRGAMQSLMAPTTDAAAAMKAAGYESGEALIKERGMAGALQFLADAAAETGKPLQSMVSSIEGQVAVMALTGPQAADYAKKLAEMGNAAGATNDAFWEQTQGINALGFAFDQAKAVGQVALQKIGDVLGNVLKPALQPIIEGARALVENWDELTGKIDPSVWAGLAGAIAGALVPAIWAAVTGLWAFISPLIPFLAIGAAVGLAINYIVEQLGGWSTVIGAVKDAWGFLVDGFTGGGDPAALVSGPFKAIYDAGAKVREIFDAIKEAWKLFTIGFQGGALGSLAASFSPVAKAGSELRDVFESWKDTAITVFNAVKEQAGPVFEQIQASFGKLKGSMGPALESLKSAWDSLKPALTTVAQIIGGVVVVAMGIVIGVINGIIQAIGPWIRAMGGLVNIVASVFNLIVGIFTGDGEKIKAAVGGIAQGVMDYFTGMRDAALGLISGFVEGIVGFFTGLYDTLVGHSIIPDMVNAIIDWIGQLPGRAFAFMSDLVTKVITKATEMHTRFVAKVSELVSGVVTWLSGLPGRAVSALGNIVGTLAGKGSDLITGLWNGAKNIWTQVSGWVGGLGGKVVSAIGDLSTKLKSAGISIINGFFNGLKQKWDEVKGWVSGIGEWIADNKGPLDYDRKLLIPAGTAIMGGFHDSLKDKFRDVQALVKGMGTDLSAMIPDLSVNAGMTPALSGAASGYSNVSSSKILQLAPGAIVVQGAGDPDAVAERVMRKLHRLGVKI